MQFHGSDTELCGDYLAVAVEGAEVWEDGQVVIYEKYTPEKMGESGGRRVGGGGGMCWNAEGSERARDVTGGSGEGLIATGGMGRDGGGADAHDGPSARHDFVHEGLHGGAQL